MDYYVNVSEREIPLFVNADVTKVNEKTVKVTGVNVTIDGKEKQSLLKQLY